MTALESFDVVVETHEKKRAKLQRLEAALRVLGMVKAADQVFSFIQHDEAAVRSYRRCLVLALEEKENEKTTTTD